MQRLCRCRIASSCLQQAICALKAVPAMPSLHCLSGLVGQEGGGMWLPHVSASGSPVIDHAISCLALFLNGNGFVGQEHGLGKQGTLLYAGPFAAVVELQ